MYRLLCLLPLFLTACTAAQQAGIADAAPQAVPLIVEGAGGAAVNPANPVPWVKIAFGCALILAGIWGGPPAVQKVRGFSGTLREWFASWWVRK